LLGYDGEFDLALQDVENHIRRTALRKHRFTGSIFDDGVTAAIRTEKDFRIEAAWSAGLGPTTNVSLDHVSVFLAPKNRPSSPGIAKPSWMRIIH
jgi:hypothetical protein